MECKCNSTVTGCNRLHSRLNGSVRSGNLHYFDLISQCLSVLLFRPFPLPYKRNKEMTLLQNCSYQLLNYGRSMLILFLQSAFPTYPYLTLLKSPDLSRSTQFWQPCPQVPNVTPPNQGPGIRLDLAKGLQISLRQIV